ncbi:YafY family protein [Orbus sturtevantii]|uniref:helix-turn-helix transcriptional regulator n=1 Tax=Orbus sturtevantii TaxID=3074109 RepID=UPI00370D5A21
MYINRLFGIVHLLLNNKQLTSIQLAEHFEVSKRTILRDLDVLSGAGIPIYTSQGKGGGISILDSYTLNKMAISAKEQSSILSSLQGFNSLTNSAQDQPDHLLAKLSHLFGKNQANWIEVDFANWADYDHRQAKVEILKNAIVNHLAVEFTYANSQGEQAKRKVYPVKLLFKSQDWYLQGYCQAKLAHRFFKLNRINQLTLLDHTFDPSLLPEFSSEEAIDSRPPLIDMTITFSPKIAYRVYDEFAFNTIIENDDKSLTVTISMTAGDWLLQYLLSYGNDAKVNSPQSLIDALKQKATAIINLYR